MVHIVTSRAKFVKSSDVTPKALVSRAPNADPVKAPPFSMLIRVANRVASTPCDSKKYGSGNYCEAHLDDFSENWYTAVLSHINNALSHACRNFKSKAPRNIANIPLTSYRVQLNNSTDTPILYHK